MFETRKIWLLIDEWWRRGVSKGAPLFLFEIAMLIYKLWHLPKYSFIVFIPIIYEVSFYKILFLLFLWLRTNFQGLTLIESLLKLSEIQNNILVARSRSFELWSYKSPFNGYVFDTPISSSNGPTNIDLGDTIQIKVTNALYAASQNPVVSVNDNDALIRYKNGLAYIQAIPKHKGLNTYSGQTIRYLKKR